MQYSSLATLLVLACQLAASATAGRDGAFHGYTERAGPDAADAASAPPCRDKQSACPDWASKGECQRNPGFMQDACRVSCKLCTPLLPDPARLQSQLLVLSTKLGDIRIQPFWDTAPKTCLLIMDLAAQEQASKSGCKFYRNEAVPAEGAGPPYGLLQGTLAGMLEPPPSEASSTHPATRGAVAMITGAEFYISLMDHSSWSTAHTVWGRVVEADMEVVDRIVSSSPYHKYTHPDYGTVMRLMKEDVPFMPSLLRPADVASQSTAEL